jgi:hypothetical protein
MLPARVSAAVLLTAVGIGCLLVPYFREDTGEIAVAGLSWLGAMYIAIVDTATAPFEEMGGLAWSLVSTGAAFDETKYSRD